MTRLELKLNLPDRLAREAQAAGLLTPDALSGLLKDAMRRRAAQALLAGAARALLGTLDRMPFADLGALLRTLALMITNGRPSRDMSAKVLR